MLWQWEWTCPEAQRVYGTYAEIKYLMNDKYKVGRDLQTCASCVATQESISLEDAIVLIMQKRTHKMQDRALLD